MFRTYRRAERCSTMGTPRRPARTALVPDVCNGVGVCEHVRKRDPPPIVRRKDELASEQSCARQRGKR